MAPSRKWWNWHDDRQWSPSRMTKSGGGKWFDAPSTDPKEMLWALEVRSEDMNGSSVRMGELFFRGSLDGTLTLSIREEPLA